MNIELSVWSVAEARRRFSEVIRAAGQQPQLIKNRARSVAVVVDADEYARFSKWNLGEPQRTVGEAFEELREICREEPFELVAPERRDRVVPPLGD